MAEVKYRIEGAQKGSMHKSAGEDQDDDEYEEDFEQFQQEESGDEEPGTPGEQLKQRIKTGHEEVRASQSNVSLMDSKYQLKVQEEANSPKPLAKDKSQSKYYDDLEESHQLKLK